MTYHSPDAESALELATLALFEELGWPTLNAYHEVYSEDGTGIPPGVCYLGRATRGEDRISWRSPVCPMR